MTNEQYAKLNEAMGIITDYLLKTNNIEELEETSDILIKQIKGITDVKISTIRENEAE